MNMKRWLISVIVACIGFFISFILSFQVNNFDTSLKRGLLSFVFSFGLYELLRFIAIYSVGDLFLKKEDTNEGENPEHLDIDAEEKRENMNTINEDSDQAIQNAVDKQKVSVTLQDEKDYANVAQFVKSELIKSESESM